MLVKWELLGGAGGSSGAFVLPDGVELSAQSLRSSFPIPGLFHFRVRQVGARGSACWRDVSSGDDSLSLAASVENGTLIHVRALQLTEVSRHRQPSPSASPDYPSRRSLNRSLSRPERFLSTWSMTAAKTKPLRMKGL